MHFERVVGNELAKLYNAGMAPDLAAKAIFEKVIAAGPVPEKQAVSDVMRTCGLSYSNAWRAYLVGREVDTLVSSGMSRLEAFGVLTDRVTAPASDAPAATHSYPDGIYSPVASQVVTGYSTASGSLKRGHPGEHSPATGLAAEEAGKAGSVRRQSKRMRTSRSTEDKVGAVPSSPTVAAAVAEDTSRSKRVVLHVDSDGTPVAGTRKRRSGRYAR